MFLLSMMVFVVLLQSSAGDPFCSLNDILIDCVSCSQICKNQVCFLCPKQCGKSNDCISVCKPTCFNQTCEYVSDGRETVCTKGCIDGRAGRQCQEYCSGGCKTCDQDTGKKCESCWEGLEGQHCNTTNPSSQSTVTSPSSSLKCPKECELCKDGTNCQAPCDCTGLTIDSTQFPLTSTSSLASITTDTPGQSYKLETVATVIAAAVAVTVVVICIATMCMYRKMRRSNPQLLEVKQNKSQVDNPRPLEMEQNTNLVEIPGNRRESDPYAFIVVVDRDCVPEHLLQAAIVTSPQLGPNI